MRAYMDIGNFSVALRKQLAAETSVASLLGKLAEDANEEVKAAVAGNPHTPKTALKKLATEKSYFIRLKVAKNLNTPKKVLREMNDDYYFDIRVESKDTLRKLDEETK